MDDELQPPVDGVAEAAPVVPKTCMLAVLEMVCSGFVIYFCYFFDRYSKKQNIMQRYEEISN